MRAFMRAACGSASFETLSHLYTVFPGLMTELPLAVYRPLPSLCFIRLS